MKRQPRGQEGITLVELLISVVIMSMLTGALASVFVTAMRDSRPTLQRLRESNDAQVIAGFLIRDAQAAGGSNPFFGSKDPTLGVSRGGAAACGSGTPILQFTWIDRSATGTTKNVAAYTFDPAQNSLTRTLCVGAASPNPLELGRAVASVTAQCQPACTTAGVIYLPDTVSLTLAETNDPPNAASPYTYTLRASVRPQGQGAQNTSNSTLVPLLTLGGGGCSSGASGLYMSGNGNVRVYGDVEVNSADPGCPAMVASGSISYNPGGTEILSGGTCSGSACPAYDTYSPALSDPFSSLPVPPGVPAACTGTNPAPVGGVYPAGVYPNLLSITGGNVSFATGGIFTFCHGLSISGSAQVSGTNILLYFQGGTLTTSGGGQVTFDDSANAGTYPGLAIWQAASNTATMSIAGTPNQTILGTIYAPSATVQLSGNANTTQVTAIIAQTVVVLGNNTVNIGTPAPNPLVISTPASGTLPASTVGIAYTATITATGGSGVNTWNASGLPAGLAINAANGKITGTPTVSGAFSVAVNVVDTLGDQASKTYGLTIHLAPSITGPASLSSWDLGRDYPGTVMTGSNGTAPYIWSATGLPPGLSISATSGAISGNPTTIGTYAPSIKLTDNVGATTTRVYANVKINALPAISGPISLPNWTVGQPYPTINTTMTATLGTTPYTWTQNGLPPGLTINAATGVISGKPTAAGTYSVTVTVKDVAGVTDSRSYSVLINPSPSFGTASLAQAEINIPYSTTLSAATGTPPYSWSATGLPATLSLNASTGVISGTPTAVANYSVTVTLTDSSGSTVNHTYSLVVNPAPSITGPLTLPSWTITRDYVGQTITATGGITPYSWSATGMPPGLSIDASTGVISGTPTSTGTFTILVKVTDNAGVTAQVTYSNVVINGLPSVSTSTLPTGEQTVAYPNTTLVATGGTSPYTWSISNPPPGLSVNAVTGVLSGTPTAFGTYSVTVTATDKAGATAPRTISVSILPPPSVSSVTLPSWTVNTPYPNTTITGNGGTGPYTFTSTALPAGLALNGITGVVSGTPTAIATTSLTVTVHDVLGATATQVSSIKISAAPAISSPGGATLPAWTVGAAYSTTITATGGTAPITWSAAALPAGLTINAATGVISGTPSAAGTFTNIIVTATDAAGVAANHTYSLTVNAAPTITAVQLLNGGTAGRVDPGDQIVVTFSQQMSVSSLCSTWATDTNNQAFSGNGAVTATLADGTGPANDSITVAASGCTFNFGSLDLGSTAYVSGGAVTFSGNGGNASTIAWNAATHQLTIVLGNNGGPGTVATVAASAPRYTVPAAVTDSAGAPVSNSPFALANGQKF